MTQSETANQSRFAAILLQRCPVCLDGRVFNSLLGMNKTCPECGILYERESGYFLNAMFVAYVIGFLIFGPLALVLYFMQVSGLWFSIIMLGLIFVLWPFIFRYSRVIWMHADQLIDPREIERG